MKSYIGYFYVLLTVIFEAVGFYFLTKANGFVNMKYLIIGLIFFNLTTISFAMALKTIDLTMANVLWVSSSLVMSSAIGYIAFHDKYTLFQYVLIFTMLCCVVGLNLTGIKK